MIQLTDNIWAVEVPEDAQDFIVRARYTAAQAEGVLIYFDYRGASAFKIIPHPHFEFLFTTKDATWEQAESVVEKINGWYKNYAGDVLYSNPVDSLQSLLKAKRCDVKQNWAIIQKL